MTDIIEGKHEWSIGINLHELCKLLVILRGSSNAHIEIKTNTDHIETILKTRNSIVEYKFWSKFFEYKMMDRTGNPIRFPDRAQGWAIKTALTWLGRIMRYVETPLDNQTIIEDAKRFIEQFTNVNLRDPTEEEMYDAYRMCPVYQVVRGVPQEEIKRIREKVIE